MVLELRRPLATHVLAHLELIGILHTFYLQNFEHLVPVCKTFVHVLAPLQRLATTLESTVDTLATTLVQELKPCGSTTLIHGDAEFPHLAVFLFLGLLNDNPGIVVLASSIGQDKTCAYILNNIGEVWQGSFVVLHIDDFLQFEICAGVAEVFLHPQLTIVVFGYRNAGVGSAQQLYGRTGNTGRMDTEHLVLIIEVWFPVKQFAWILALQRHVYGQLGTNVVESVRTLCSIADKCPHLALVVLVRTSHHDRSIGIIIAIVGNGLACIGGYNTVHTANRLRMYTQGKCACH